jgi:hypothetical protein
MTPIKTLHESDTLLVTDEDIELLRHYIMSRPCTRCGKLGADHESDDHLWEELDS